MEYGGIWDAYFVVVRWSYQIVAHDTEESARVGLMHRHGCLKHRISTIHIAFGFEPSFPCGGSCASFSDLSKTHALRNTVRFPPVQPCQVQQLQLLYMLPPYRLRQPQERSQRKPRMKVITFRMGWASRILGKAGATWPLWRSWEL